MLGVAFVKYVPECSECRCEFLPGDLIIKQVTLLKQGKERFRCTTCIKEYKKTKEFVEVDECDECRLGHSADKYSSPWLCRKHWDAWCVSNVVKNNMEYHWDIIRHTTELQGE